MLQTIALALAAARLALPAPDVAGDWAGWLYLDDGDVPVRLHLAAGAEGLVADIDLPAAGNIGVRLGSAAIEGDALVLAHPSADDARIRLEIELADGPHLRGAVEWQGVGGRVELHRAAHPLAWQEPDAAAELVGVYGEPAAPLAVRAQPWGELVLVDPVRGDERTLFARPDGGYVVGPALYVPAPIEREVSVERDADGAVVALVVRAGGGERRHARRPLRTEEVTVERDGATLAGTLTLAGDAGAPCAVIAGGSNWSDRSRVESARVLLAALGVSSVTYDKRGWGSSGGERTVPFATTAADLRAFADAARANGGCDPARVGYLGLSRGGWYGALAAAEDSACAFFVSVVGPAVSPIEQETTARLDRMLERGASEADLALAGRYLRAMWDHARRGGDGERYLELRARVDEAGWLGELLGPAELEGDDWTWTRLNGDFDQRAALRSLRCPTLALFGELDLAVAARVNAPLMRDALWYAAVEPARVLVLPQVDHGLHVVARDQDGTRAPFHRTAGRHPDAWSSIAAFVHAR